ncbi:cation diffusion facilitator family transporter [uncultured Oscillibacter sp.]|jgi:cation diffusion facilitator family transporter|uniref:cation diffusion facilitator family transporter n=1 Tax=uncultured Oscillibacter sp. TaxID=876091 RepID=UPI002D7EDE36|nr:cation diffusion facilitator family transporter [uncultured Oscillibacter sp.]
MLARVFLKPEGKTEAQVRKGYGVLCGAVGVCLNLLLFLGKLLAGLASGSIAVVADAVNNLSDAGSSIVTLLGFHLAEQKPDHDHPFGHGRAEYLSGLVVAMLILLMGFELAQSSVGKILNPVPAEGGWRVTATLCAAIAVKVYMAFYNRRIGKRIGSTAMEAAALDSLGDCAATSVVLLASLVERYTDLVLDGWGGLLVALFILWSGFQAAKTTMDPLLGTPPSAEFVEEIRTLVLAHQPILGVHDIIVHDYGPGRRMISLHAEVPAGGELLELHSRIDHVERELRERLGCEAVIHMDPVCTDDGVTQETRKRVEALVRCIDGGITIHDFRVVPREGKGHVHLVFDAAVPFDFRLSDQEVEEKIKSAVQVLDSGFQAKVRVERSYT